MEARAGIAVPEHGAGLDGGGERVGVGRDVVVGAGEHVPEGGERAAGHPRAEERGEDRRVRDDVAAGQVVERPERVREVAWEADVEGEEGVGEVPVREEAARAARPWRQQPRRGGGWRRSTAARETGDGEEEEGPLLPPPGSRGREVPGVEEAEDGEVRRRGRGIVARGCRGAGARVARRARRRPFSESELCVASNARVRKGFPFREETFLWRPMGHVCT